MDKPNTDLESGRCTFSCKLGRMQSATHVCIQFFSSYLFPFLKLNVSGSGLVYSKRFFSFHSKGAERRKPKTKRVEEPHYLASWFSCKASERTHKGVQKVPGLITEVIYKKPIIFNRNLSAFFQRE